MTLLLVLLRHSSFHTFTSSNWKFKRNIIIIQLFKMTHGIWHCGLRAPKCRSFDFESFEEVLVCLLLSLPSITCDFMYIILFGLFRCSMNVWKKTKMRSESKTVASSREGRNFDRRPVLHFYTRMIEYLLCNWLWTLSHFKVELRIKFHWYVVCL